MARKHRRPPYTLNAEEDSRELRVFVSSLIIGACIGAFATYFFAGRATRQELGQLRSQLVAVQQGQVQRCTGARDHQQEELESRLSTCTSTLARLQQATQQAALQTVDDTPPLPKPPPGRQTLPPVEAADIMPSLPAAPGLVAPVAPEPPSLEPQERTTQMQSAPVAAAWPQGWPPRPRPNPPRPAGTAPTVETIGDAAAATAGGPAAPLRGAETVTLNVGEERDVNGYRLRLIAVALRSTGQFCIVGGNGMVGQRIASNTSKRVNWNGHSVTLQASVQDKDTCRIALRPG